MPGSQPGVLGLFTTPAKLLKYNNIINPLLSKILAKENILFYEQTPINKIFTIFYYALRKAL